MNRFALILLLAGCAAPAPTAEPLAPIPLPPPAMPAGATLYLFETPAGLLDQELVATHPFGTSVFQLDHEALQMILNVAVNYPRRIRWLDTKDCPLTFGSETRLDVGPLSDFTALVRPEKSIDPGCVTLDYSVDQTVPLHQRVPGMQFKAGKAPTQVLKICLGTGAIRIGSSLLARCERDADRDYWIVLHVLEVKER